jgi:hypothetical protein
MLGAVRSPRTRRSCALVAIVALFMAQLTVVGYACPLDAAPAMAAEMPCHEADGAPQPQCTAHCQASAQAADQPKPLAAADFVAPLLAVVEVDRAAPAPRAIRAEPVPARAAAPPFRILYHRLLN